MNFWLGEVWTNSEDCLKFALGMHNIEWQLNIMPTYLDESIIVGKDVLYKCSLMRIELSVLCQHFVLLSNNFSNH